MSVTSRQSFNNILAIILLLLSTAGKSHTADTMSYSLKNKGSKMVLGFHEQL